MLTKYENLLNLKPRNLQQNQPIVNVLQSRQVGGNPKMAYNPGKTCGMCIYDCIGQKFSDWLGTLNVN